MNIVSYFVIIVITRNSIIYRMTFQDVLLQ